MNPIRRIFRGLLAIAVLPLAVAGAATPSPRPPLDQVLAKRPPALMLDYFQRLAVTLPPEASIPGSLSEWKTRREALRSRLWQSLGRFPLENRPPLNPRVTGRLDHGDHVVEKILYESLPGLYVTALLYVPKKSRGPTPAVICVNGHWAGAKADAEIQRRCLGLARMGVIAFCQDVIGTGERSGPPGIPHRGYHGNYRGAAPRITDRSLPGYVLYECFRAMDYLETRPDVDAERVLCTGSSGGGMQSMYFAALDDRLAGAVPVCYVSNYRKHMGATACVCEIPTGVLSYTDQWEILGLHAPRPLLCINASRDIEVFQPGPMLDTLEKTAGRIYRLYGAESKVTSKVFDCGHAYNLPMRELLYAHVAKHLLGRDDSRIKEPDDLPVEQAATLACGLPSRSETLQSLTYLRAREMAAAVQLPTETEAWRAQKAHLLQTLRNEILGASPDRRLVKRSCPRQFSWKGYRAEHWVLHTEPGLPVPAVLCLPPKNSPEKPRPAVIIADEQGKKHALARDLAEPLLRAGNVVLLVDLRGTGETANTVPDYNGAHDYNLVNYALCCGRPLTGMRVHDARSCLDFLSERPEVDLARIAYVGRGHLALVGVLAAALDERIQAVVAEEMLTTWVFPEEFHHIGLAYLIPRILRAGDMTHLIACVAPRPVLVLNPVDGRRRSVSVEDATRINRFARNIYTLLDGEDHLQCARGEAPEEKNTSTVLIQWLQRQGWRVE